MKKPSAIAKRTPPARSWRRAWLALAGVVVLAGGIGVYAWRAKRPVPVAVEAPPPAPPALDPLVTDPLVIEAIQKENAAVQAAPRSPAAWGRLGMVLAAHGCLPQANECLAEAERLDPREPRWPYFRALYPDKEDPEYTLPRLRRAVELCPDRADAPRLRLAEALLTQGGTEEAEREFRILLKYHPRHPRAHLGLARVAYQRGDTKAALEYLGVAEANARTRKAAHVLHSQIHQSKGDSAAAEAELRKASAAEDAAWPDPMAAEVVGLRTGLRAALARADRLLAAEKPDDALKALAGAKDTYADSDWVWLLLGRAYFQKRDLPAAEQALREAVRLGPRSDKAQFHLGLVHYFKKDYRAAADCFRVATELKPDFAQAHYNLGNCLVELRDKAGAIKAFQFAVNCKPDHVNARIDLGELLAEEGKLAEALAHLRQAVQLQPQDKRARESLDKALKRQHGS